jgi:predicted nuclease with TOPRIM domain
MSYSNYPSATPEEKPKAPKDNRKLIYGILIVALLGTWGYIVFDKNKSKENITQLQTQYTTVSTAKDSIEQQYNMVLARMDSLTGSNTQLQGALAERKAEIEKLKQSIREEMSKKNADINKLRSMINELNGKVNDYETQIAQLKAENEQLTSANQQLSVERDTLNVQKQQLATTLSATEAEKANIQDIASTFHVSNINIAAVDVKGEGKEKSTSSAKRADVLRINFTIDENRIAPSGTKELYVVVTAPDGKIITNPLGGSGTFTTREEGDRPYTTIASVQYTQGSSLPVTIDWKQETRFQSGNYKIEIYHNGFKIGEAVKKLK